MLLVKPQAWSDPSTASVIPYKSIKRFPAVYNVITTSGQTKRITVSLITDDIEFDAYKLPLNIVSDVEIEQARLSVQKLLSLANAMPKLVPHIQTLLATHRQAELALSEGKVRVNGVWVDGSLHYKQQAEMKNENEEAVRAFVTQQEERKKKERAELEERKKKERAELEERKKKERAELELQASFLTKEINDLELEIEANRQQLKTAQDEAASPVYKMRSFQIQRKLPKSDWSELYEISDYVYECITEGGEKCVYITNSITTMEERFLSAWVKHFTDVDVTLRNGNNERVPIFIEAEKHVSEKLSESYQNVNHLLEAIATISTRLKEKRTKLNEINKSIKQNNISN